MLVPNTVSSRWTSRISGILNSVDPRPTMAARPSGRSSSPTAACAALAPEVSISLSAPPLWSSRSWSPGGPADGSRVHRAPLGRGVDPDDPRAHRPGEDGREQPDRPEPGDDQQVAPARLQPFERPV